MTRPGMSDGRAFTSYLPSCQMNEDIMSKNRVSSNSEYREFLQKNAVEIINKSGRSSIATPSVNPYKN
mgnify:CR=1 FL=1